MSFGSMLDVAIGVAFIFVLLSTIASAIQEMIATVLSVRGKVMQDMIVQLLDNPATTAAGPAVPAQPEPLSRLVIGHPLVAGLSTPNLPGWLHRLIRSKSSPSYIPAANFSSALIETLRSGHDPTLAVSEQVERAVALLPAGLPLRRTLEAFITEAQGDMDLFRKKLQLWFDNSMDRASGVYKRFAQYMLLLIGLLLAIVVNADVVQLSETLWRDKGARDAVTQAAMEYVKTAMPQPPPSGSAIAVPATTQATVDALKAATGSARDAAGVVGALPLPFGWGDTFASAQGGGLSGWFWIIMGKLPGFLLTAFAVSLGAPFWFDTLTNLANLRGAGPKPDRSDAGSQGH